MQPNAHSRALPAPSALPRGGASLLPIAAVVLAVAFVLVVATPVPAPAQTQAQTPAGPQVGAGTLFPQPFVAEHKLIQADGDGSRFETEPVTDYYGGSWIVSVRPDGSRVIVDLARREITEVRPEKGTWSTLGFDRMAELGRRIARAERRGDRSTGDEGGVRENGVAQRRTDAEPPELVVQELGDAPGLVSRSAGAADPAARPAIRRLRVLPRSEAERPDAGVDAGVEVWVDPSVRLHPAALDALASFEAALAGGGGTSGARAGGDPAPVPVGRYVDRARRHAGGAVAVRTVRTLEGGRGGPDGLPASARVRLEDVTTRLEPIDDFPEELLVVPEGLRRVPHPLEGVARFLEDERERDRAMSGSPRK